MSPWEPALEGQTPGRKSKVGVNLPLTEALSITTVAAANVQVVTNKHTRQSKAHDVVTFVLLNRYIA